MVVAARAARLEPKQKARKAEGEVRAPELAIDQMKFAIAELRNERFGNPWNGAPYSSRGFPTWKRMERKRKLRRRPAMVQPIFPIKLRYFSPTDEFRNRASLRNALLHFAVWPRIDAGPLIKRSTIARITVSPNLSGIVKSGNSEDGTTA